MNEFDNKNKKVMIIAGGEWQVPIIKKAKSLGHDVINSNPYENSPGFEFSDINVIADVLDKDKNLAYALRFSPDAIITDQSDIAVPTVAFLCEKLNLMGVGVDVAKKFTNKTLMREQSAYLGNPNPNFKLCSSLSDIKLFAFNYDYPIVIKPPANQSSRGVCKVESSNQLSDAYAQAKIFSHNQSVLVESFIPGIEITIDGIKTFKRHYSLATSTKKHYDHNPMIASDLFFSNNHTEFDIAILHKQHDEFIEKMGLPFGLTHAEYKYYEGKFYLIEVAARGGGTRISSDIVPLMSGVDTNALFIKMALGDKIIEPEDFYPQDIALVLSFFNFESGKIKRINGVAEALKMTGVKALGINFQVGDMIKKPQDDRARHGYVIAYADSHEKLNQLISKIKNTVNVTYE